LELDDLGGAGRALDLETGSHRTATSAGSSEHDGLAGGFLGGRIFGTDGARAAGSAAASCCCPAWASS
jgi:hypothetical protein